MLLIDKITAQIEVRLLEFNAIVKLLRSKKFKELAPPPGTSSAAYWTRCEVYEGRQFDLLEEIDALTAQLGGKVTIWEGILTK